jgi:hypothetical protein
MDSSTTRSPTPAIVTTLFGDAATGWPATTRPVTVDWSALCASVVVAAVLVVLVAVGCYLVQVDLVEPVSALGRTDEGCAALVVCKSGADDFRPRPWIELGGFVNDNIVEVQPTHTLIIVSAIKTNPSAVRVFNP